MGLYEENKDEITAYVRKILDGDTFSKSSAKLKIRYNRFEHTRRVFHWMLRLYEAFPEKEKLDFDSLAIAVWLHDIGYSDLEHMDEHAGAGAVMCRGFLEGMGFPEEKVDFICDLVARHSDKESMFQDIPMELVLLMEADLLDDTGAQAAVIDVWIEALGGQKATFESMLGHMEAFSLAQLQTNPMRTQEAKRIWEKKRKLLEDFVESYRADLWME